MTEQLTLEFTPTAIYDRYGKLYKAITERYRQLLVEADARLDRNFAFHLAHNWGNAESQALLAKYDKVSSWIIKRGKAEYRKAEHNFRHGKKFEPLWCKACQLAKH